MNKERTPLQEAIERNYTTIKQLEEQQYHTKEGSDEYREYDVVIYFLLAERQTLNSLLDYEKQFMEKVWDEGRLYGIDNEPDGTGYEAPDFTTYYSKY